METDEVVDGAEIEDGDEIEDGADVEPEPDPEPEPPRRRRGARAVAQAAVEQVVEMTGRRPEGVTSVSRNGENWLVEVEVVEAHRIPDSADVLAVYEAELDDDAELMSYRRTRRYTRGGGED
ncbi:gas vesicle protein GvpO [Pseudonocardia phyllosphaerae]|uniref:gas vesicle protein GvpO n=1 Tax=Pseudonocardia phyllosphaerae TaxID=3390502 RepID=UPI00397B856C